MRKRMLCCLLALLFVFAVPVAAAGEDVVIVLDPGHGGLDSGAEETYDGVEVWESNLNLAIAMACRDYLEEHYENVTVYLTREEDKKVSLEERVAFAEEHEADYMLSIHLNADKGNAHGALALVPRGKYHPEQARASVATAEAILEELEALGLRNLGTVVQLGTDRYPDGSYVDAFAIIRGCVRRNIPAIIMEHAFMDNRSDYEAYLSTPEKLEALGKADALGLAKTLGLVEKEAEPEAEPEWSLPFGDVPEGAWYSDAVCYAWEQGLIQGISENEFAPAQKSNRAMVVTLLYRLEERELQPEESSFADVEAGSWYHAPVEWALDNGITTGISETEFAPGRNVLREQFVTFLYRYAGEPEPEYLADWFADWDSISGYARNAVSWAVAEGLMTGYDDGTVGPLRELNRAELAVLMERFHRWYLHETEEPTEPEESEESWYITHEDVSIKVGESFRLRVKSSSGETMEVDWVAGKSGIVSIDGNTITGKAKGTVTVSCEYEGQVFRCVVRVKNA